MAGVGAWLLMGSSFEDARVSPLALATIVGGLAILTEVASSETVVATTTGSENLLACTDTRH